MTPEELFVKLRLLPVTSQMLRDVVELSAEIRGRVDMDALAAECEAELRVGTPSDLT